MKYLGYNKNRKKSKSEGQLPDHNKTFPPGPDGQLKKIAKDEEINGIKDYPANTSRESLELLTCSCSS
jgi:hypothetical protein